MTLLNFRKKIKHVWDRISQFFSNLLRKKPVVSSTPSVEPAPIQQNKEIIQILERQITNFKTRWAPTPTRDKVLEEVCNYSQTTSIEALQAKIQTLTDYERAEVKRLHEAQIQLRKVYDTAHITYQALLKVTDMSKAHPQLDHLNQALVKIETLYDATRNPPFQAYGEKAYYETIAQAKVILNQLPQLVIQAELEAKDLNKGPSPSR